MAIVLFDANNRENFFPFTPTKAIAALRFGICTIQERWQLLLGQTVYIQTANYLQNLYPKVAVKEQIWIDASVIPNPQLIRQIKSLQPFEAIVDEAGLIAGNVLMTDSFFDANNYNHFFKKIQQINRIERLKNPQQIFQLNHLFIQDDFANVTMNKISQTIDKSNQIICPENIFVEAGAHVQHAILNASTGPIYIGKNATIMEGSIIRGPFAMCENAVVKMGAKIYGATTLGKNVIAGGEIKNSIICDNSNKAHDGYLGDSMIGEWCNLGAGTNNSNIKNNAGAVTLWNQASQRFEDAGMKCGVMMGDYTRVAINSSINTGSVFGVCCNVFGEGLLPKMIQNFSWGKEKYRFEKAIQHIDNWKKLKGSLLTEEEKIRLKFIFDKSEKN
jgi:UDP-N-acetylglucosamine diphosphorylase/glucosamine-1-phosphate N-acetyltransferase